MSARERLPLLPYLVILGLVAILPVVTFFSLQALREHQYSRMEKDIELAYDAIRLELTYSQDTGIRPRRPAEPIRGSGKSVFSSGEEDGVPYRQWRHQMGFAGYPDTFLDCGFRLHLEQKRPLFLHAPALRVIYSSKEEEKTLRGLVEGALQEQRLAYTVVVR